MQQGGGGPHFRGSDHSEVDRRSSNPSDLSQCDLSCTEHTDALVAVPSTQEGGEVSRELQSEALGTAVPVPVQGVSGAAVASANDVADVAKSIWVRLGQGRCRKSRFEGTGIQLSGLTFVFAPVAQGRNRRRRATGVEVRGKTARARKKIFCKYICAFRAGARARPAKDWL